MDAAVETAGLTLLEVTKAFGAAQVLRGVSLRVAPGEVTALVGPNGAGKTTLLRIAAGIASASAGRVLIDGEDMAVRPSQAKAKVGYVGDRPVNYGALTAEENLLFFAGLYGIDREKALGKATAALSRFGLAHRAQDRASTLSHGMAQRLSLSRAMLHSPSVLLLDEPFEGLDAAGQAELTAAIRGKTGRATVLASHQLDLCLEVADVVAVIAQGKLEKVVPAASTTFDELTSMVREMRGT